MTLEMTFFKLEKRDYLARGGELSFGKESLEVY